MCWFWRGGGDDPNRGVDPCVDIPVDMMGKVVENSLLQNIVWQETRGRNELSWNFRKSENISHCYFNTNTSTSKILLFEAYTRAVVSTCGFTGHGRSASSSVLVVRVLDLPDRA